MISVSVPLPRARRRDGTIHGPRIVFMTEPGSVRIQHVANSDEARACHLAWCAGDFRRWPGELRKFEQ